MAQVAMASPWGAILVVLLAWLSASLSISMADETPPKRSASEVQAARRARKIRHMDARLGREFMYGELGCHEESSDSKDSPTFSLSTISDYSPIRGDLSETAAPLGGDAMAFACLRDGIPPSAIRAAVASKVDVSRLLECIASSTPGFLIHGFWPAGNR